MFFTSFLRKKKREKKSFLSHSKSTTFHKALSIIFFPYYNLLFIFFLLRRRRSPRAKIVLLIFFHSFYLSLDITNNSLWVKVRVAVSLKRFMQMSIFIIFPSSLNFISKANLKDFSKFLLNLWISLSWPDFFMQIQSTTNWRWKSIKQTHFIYS